MNLVTIERACEVCGKHFEKTYCSLTIEDAEANEVLDMVVERHMEEHEAFDKDA